MTEGTQDVAEFVRERNKALETLDMEYARRTIPHATSDEVRLIAMHKARYDCTGISDVLRLQSRHWLEERGYRRLGGLAFPADKYELPK